MFITTRLVVAAVGGAVIAAIAAIAGATAAAIAIAVADGVLLVLAVGDVAYATSPASLRPARALPDALTMGAPAVSSVRLTNPESRVMHVWFRDAAPPSLRMTPLRQRVDLPASSSAVVETELRPSRRGLIPLGPLTLRVDGPLGLAGRQRAIPLPTTLKVYPALPGRAEAQLRFDRARVTQSGERSSAMRGGGTEFDSLREYHPDDEFRRINWHATARAAKPISNVFREERNQHVLLLLDAGRMMAATVEGVPRFEWGVDAAMAVADVAARVGDHVGLACFAADLVAMVPPRSARTQPSRILEALFALEPTLDAPNYARVFGSLLSRWRRRSLLVLITELTDEQAMEPLIAALPILLRRHLVTVAAVADPAMTTAALSIPVSSEDVYLKAAAARASDARDRVATRLRAMGAVVIDRPPGALAGALVDAYLNEKASGRL